MATKLTDIPDGTRLRITGFEQTSRYSDHLCRLGLVPGTEVTVVRRAPLGDPLEIRLRGYSLALRPSEAIDLVFEIIAP